MSELVKSAEKDGMDLLAIRKMVEESSTSYNGLKGKDIDWFLRDSSVNHNAADVPEATPELVDTGVKEHVVEKVKESLEPKISSELRHNSNTTTHLPNGTSVSVAKVNTQGRHINEKAHDRALNPPVTAVAPPGGFFNKLKGRFHRSGSVSESKESMDPLVLSPFSPPLSAASSISMQPESHEIETPKPLIPKEPKIDDYVKFYKQQEVRDGRRSSLLRRSSLSSAPGSPYIGAFDPNCADMEKEEEAEVNHPKFSFIKRKSVVAAEKLQKSSVSSPAANGSDVSLGLVQHHPSFKDLKPLKRVAFHSRTFLIDPPQQIPSRSPRKGNVELSPTGGVKIHPLSEEDKLAIEKSQTGLGGGMVVGGSGSLGFLTAKERAELEENESEGESEGEMIQAPIQEEPEVSEEDTAVDSHAKMLGIDKPMVSHHYIRNYNMPVEKMALDVLYTRCCHLREILPIPSILKQIPKGSMAPLPLLQIRNPAPTLIEIQTFADFIRIAPIICVSVDGVSLSIQQFKILLSAMAAKTQLEQLSMRNTPIDSEGWSLLCWFLSRNTVLNRLDITQCPSLTVNVLKRRKKKSNEESKKFEVEMPRMESNSRNRSDMDWSLFVATLIARGGMEDLILTGCCITDIEVFEKLITLAVLKKTYKLGLAYNKLTPKHFKIIVENWLFQDFALGIDLGYNDFSDPEMLRLLLEYSKTPEFSKKLAKSSLTFLSLNSTNPLFSEDFRAVIEKVLLKLPRLKYFDFSNNPSFFEDKEAVVEETECKGYSDAKHEPHEALMVKEKKEDHESGEKHVDSHSNKAELICRPNDKSVVAYLVSKLPLFPILVRLHLEHNNFSLESIVSVSEILPFCKYLGYFSLLGNKLDLIAGSALIQALKNSSSLITLECDYEQFPTFFKEKIGLYSMRNMERLLKKEQSNIGINGKVVEEEATLTEQLNTVLEMKSRHALDLNSPEVTTFVARAHKVRVELKQVIDELLKVQLRNELNLEGKEALIRFIFIDASIEKGLMLIDISLADDEHPHSMTMYGTAESKSTYITPKLTKQTTEDSPPNNNLVVPKQALANGVRPSVSPLANSRSSSRLNLQSLDRQEGSMLKLAKLHSTHNDDPNYKYLFNSLESLSGEQIRSKLLAVNYSDLDKIIDYVGKLKKEGISLENLFQNDEGTWSYKDHMRDDGLEMDDIKKKLQELTSCADDVEEQHAPPTEAKDTKETEDSGKGEINDAYDQVLNNLANAAKAANRKY